jgi:hypothetical protein
VLQGHSDRVLLASPVELNRIRAQLVRHRALFAQPTRPQLECRARRSAARASTARILQWMDKDVSRFRAPLDTETLALARLRTVHSAKRMNSHHSIHHSASVARPCHTLTPILVQPLVCV